MCVFKKKNIKNLNIENFNILKREFNYASRTAPEGPC